MANFPKKIHFKHMFNESPFPPLGFFPIEGTNDSYRNRPLPYSLTRYRYGVSTPLNIGKVGNSNLETFRLYPHIDYYQERTSRFKFYQIDGYLFALPDVQDGWPYIYKNGLGNFLYPTGSGSGAYLIDIMNFPTVPGELTSGVQFTPGTALGGRDGSEFWWTQGKINDATFSRSPNSNYGEDIVPLLKNSNFSYRHVFDPGVDHMGIGGLSSPTSLGGSGAMLFSCNKNKPWSLLGDSFAPPFDSSDPISTVAGTWAVPGAGAGWSGSTFFTGIMVFGVTIETATVKSASVAASGPASMGTFFPDSALDLSGDLYPNSNRTFIQDINGNYFPLKYETLSREIKYFDKKTLVSDIDLVSSNTPAPGTENLSAYDRLFRQIAVPAEDKAAHDSVNGYGRKFVSATNVRLSEPDPFGNIPIEVIADLYYENVANQFEVGDRAYIVTHQIFGFIWDGFSLNSDGTNTPVAGVVGGPDPVTSSAKINQLFSTNQFYFNGNNFHDFEIILKTIGSGKKVGSEFKVNTTAPYVLGFGSGIKSEEDLLEWLGYGPDGMPRAEGDLTELDVEWWRQRYIALTPEVLSSPSLSTKMKKPSSTKSSFTVPTTGIFVQQGDSFGIDSGFVNASKRFKLKEFEIYGGSTPIGGWKVGNI